MTISVKCKKCKQGYKVGDDKAGLRLKCKQCGASIRVPQADDFDDVFADDPLGLGDIEYEAPATAALPSSVSRTKSAGKSPVALIATLVGVFAFFGGSIAGYSLKALLSIPQTPVSSPQTAANDEGIAAADKAPSSGMTPPPKKESSDAPQAAGKRPSEENYDGAKLGAKKLTFWIAFKLRFKKEKLDKLSSLSVSVRPLKDVEVTWSKALGVLTAKIPLETPYSDVYLQFVQKDNRGEAFDPWTLVEIDTTEKNTNDYYPKLEKKLREAFAMPLLTKK
jgi:hypothetical protein